MSDTTNDVGPKRRQLGAAAPREVSLSWLPWAPWKFAQSGIPEPTARLLTRESGASDRRIMEHNRQADQLKLSVSQAAAKRDARVAGELGGDGSGAGSSDSAEAILNAKEPGPTIMETLIAFFGNVYRFFFDGGRAMQVVKSFSVLLRVSHQNTVEAINTHRDSEARALNLYALSAGQGNADAHLRLGDFHYYGLGWLEVDKLGGHSIQTPPTPHTPHIQSGRHARDRRWRAQNFHLAKRFYDQAAVVHGNTYRAPVALFVLQSHQFLLALLGAFVGEITAQLADMVQAVMVKVQTVGGRLRDTALSAVYSDGVSPLSRRALGRNFWSQSLLW